MNKKYPVIPGLTAHKIQADIKPKNKVSNDTQNRDYVARTGEKYIKEGLSEEEAIDKLMNDKIVKEFEYLTKNGLDIRNCFKNWIDKEMRTPKRQNQRSLF